MAPLKQDMIDVTEEMRIKYPWLRGHGSIEAL